MNTKNRNIILPILMTILIVTGMVAAADIFDNKEIIFPEIAAWSHQNWHGTQIKSGSCFLSRSVLCWALES